MPISTQNQQCPAKDFKIPKSWRGIISRAMQAPETWVVQFDYAGSNGARTRRTVSPVRFLNPERLLGLCLGREAPRQFYLSRMDNLQLLPAHEVLMPVPITTIPVKTIPVMPESSGLASISS